MDKEMEQNSKGMEGTEGGGEAKGEKKEDTGGGGDAIPRSDSGGGEGGGRHQPEERKQVGGGGEDERRLSEGEGRKVEPLYPRLSPDSSVEELPGPGDDHQSPPGKLPEVGQQSTPHPRSAVIREFLPCRPLTTTV